jgi:hypothetical protein
MRQKSSPRAASVNPIVGTKPASFCHGGKAHSPADGKPGDSQPHCERSGQQESIDLR